MKYSLTLIYIFILSFYAFSQNDVEQMKSVYYPIDSLLNTKKVYKYKVYQNFYLTSYLYQVYWARVEDNDTFVYQETYNGHLVPEQVWKIKVSYKGINLIEQETYEFGKSKILRSDQIEWELSNKLKYVWKIENTEKKLKRIRTSASVSDSLEFQMKKYLTYTFTDKIIVKDYNIVGKADKRKLIRTSYHLENIGLYKSIQKYRDVFITFELEEIIDYSEWMNNR